MNANRGEAQPKKTLRAFSSEQELTAYFRQIAEEVEARTQNAAALATCAPEAISAPVAESAQANADAKAKGDE